MKRQQIEAQLSDADAQIETRFNAAVAEGDAVSADICDRYKRRHDDAARQTQLIEMLAYGGDPKPR